MDQLESLLNELQSTTSSLKQSHHTTSPVQERRPESYSSDKEPLYEPQHIVTTTKMTSAASPCSPPPAKSTYSEHGLQDLEQLLDDYSSHRGRTQKGRPTVESLLGELDTAVVSNGESKKHPTASSASKDLDNLMSSLAEFKIRSVTKTTTKTTTKGGGKPSSSPQLSPSTGGTSSGDYSATYSHPVNATQASTGPEEPVSHSRVVPISYTDSGIAKYTASSISDVAAARPLTASQTVGLQHSSSSSNEQQRVVRSAGDTDQLDSILGSLSSDLSKHGIATIPKGDCAACHKTIVGQVVIALGRMWHPEHFTCFHCKEELGHRNFFERSGCAYCERDYHDLFSPRCAYCNGPIKDKCVTALDKTWHPEHFFCATCGREFGDEGFHERDGRAFCRADYFSAFAPKCRGCKRPITDNYITALNHQWHPECFVCQECRQPFTAGSFFDHDDQPFCETHYHERRGSLCASCLRPIAGKCVAAMGRKFHPDHFVCSFCLHQLNKGTFKEHERKPYCHKCFAKLLQ